MELINCAKKTLRSTCSCVIQTSHKQAKSLNVKGCDIIIDNQCCTMIALEAEVILELNGTSKWPKYKTLSKNKFLGKSNLAKFYQMFV